MPVTSDTSIRILDAAEFLVQTRGYNGFSYADIAERVGIRTASIHYHFPSKGDLGREVVARHRAAFRRRLVEIDREGLDPPAKLAAYARMYRDVLLDGERMCLCGMLAADVTTLPEPVRVEVDGFFAEQEGWLAGVLDSGQTAGVLSFAGPAEGEARMLVAGLEGAMLLARARGKKDRFWEVAERLVAGLAVAR